MKKEEFNIEAYKANNIKMYESIMEYLSNLDDDYENYLLNEIFNNQSLTKDKKELMLFLTIIKKISNNFHRSHNYINKIKNILAHYSEQIRNTFLDPEIFLFFKNNKRILLLLFELKIIEPGEYLQSFFKEDCNKIIENYNNFKCNNHDDYNNDNKCNRDWDEPLNFWLYFYLEIKNILDEKELKVLKQHSKFELDDENLFDENGSGIEKDCEAASRLYKKAADRGDISAMFNYGQMLYREGNKLEASKYFKMAAERGQPLAMSNYGFMLLQTEGSNRQEAAGYIKRAADSGRVIAMLNYGEMLDAGDGIPVDKKEAERYFKMASKDADSVFAYGEQFLEGKLFERDFCKAAKFIKMAADNGSRKAMHKYGLMLIDGEGIEKDEKEGCRYLDMANEKDNKDAMRELMALQ